MKNSEDKIGRWRGLFRERKEIMKKSLCSRLKVITKRSRNKNHKIVDVVGVKKQLKSNKAEFYHFVNEVWRDLKVNLENRGRRFRKKHNPEKRSKASLAIIEAKSGKTVFFNLVDEFNLPLPIIFGRLDPTKQKHPTVHPYFLDEENKKELLNKLKNFFNN